MGLSEDHHDTSIDRDSTRDSHDLPWPKRDTFPAHVACALASVTAMFQDRIRNVTVAFSSLSVVHDSIDDKRETPRHPPCWNSIHQADLRKVSQPSSNLDRFLCRPTSRRLAVSRPDRPLVLDPSRQTVRLFRPKLSPSIAPGWECAAVYQESRTVGFQKINEQYNIQISADQNKKGFLLILFPSSASFLSITCNHYDTFSACLNNRRLPVGIGQSPAFFSSLFSWSYFFLVSFPSIFSPLERSLAFCEFLLNLFRSKEGASRCAALVLFLATLLVYIGVQTFWILRAGFFGHMGALESVASRLFVFFLFPASFPRANIIIFLRQPLRRRTRTAQTSSVQHP